MATTKLLVIEAHAVLTMEEDTDKLLYTLHEGNNVWTTYWKTFEGAERLIAKRLSDLWKELESNGIRVNHGINGVATYPIGEE